jgi:hypothetical protein
MSGKGASKENEKKKTDLVKKELQESMRNLNVLRNELQENLGKS